MLPKIFSTEVLATEAQKSVVGLSRMLLLNTVAHGTCLHYPLWDSSNNSLNKTIYLIVSNHTQMYHSDWTISVRYTTSNRQRNDLMICEKTLRLKPILEQWW